jgi:S-adenosylmethionine-dependent methyltransferase
MDNVENARKFYDETVNYEWRRLDRYLVEFDLSKRYIQRYIKPNDRVLDLGSGPGRYALYLSQLGFSRIISVG